MQNFMKTIISAVQSWTKKEIKNSTADWSQSDPSAVDYVKNRTHYKENVVILPNTTVTNGYYYGKTLENIVENEIYQIIFDGKMYECRAIDGLLRDVSMQQCPFSLEYYIGEIMIYTDGAEEHTISIQGPSIKKLQSVYMPDDIFTGQKGFNFGDGATASGNNSHAEGDHTTASGFSSHAEGHSTNASNSYAHAEGDSTTASGHGSHAEGNTTTASGFGSHAEGDSTTASGSYSHAEGYSTTASSLSNNTWHTTSSSQRGYCAHAEGYGTIAVGRCSHAEGNGSVASGHDSHAEGYRATASGSWSHAEGVSTKASSSYAHAEGNTTTASGETSHAEGYATTASGETSHAEGYATTASGDNSHVEGNYNVASSKAQHVQGEYAISDTAGTKTTRGKYAHIVGNGTTSLKRSNAHTLDWNGVGWFAGGLQIGGTSQDGEGVGYVPAVTAGVQPGQVLSVKAVDENGKPTEWEAVDVSNIEGSNGIGIKSIRIEEVM